MARPFLRLKKSLTFFGCSFAVFFLTTGSFTAAQISVVTQITGTVLDAQLQPVGDAQVRLAGAVSEATSTAGDGSFAFRNVPVGIYSLDVSKGGFNGARQDNIVTTAGATTNVSFSLQAASLTSLTVIGHVSASTSSAAKSINTTAASIVDVPATTFTDQGQLFLNQILNQEPGITIGVGAANFPYNCNGSSPLVGGIPSVRGGLPYETESLIDGHAISLGQQGFFSPSSVSPYILQNVEIVKGPGATSPSINYAINGTVNYRTLEPTVRRQESVDFGEDQYGGNFANFRATGTLPGTRLSYAFDYVTQGTQGFARGFTAPEILFPNGPANLNGVPINAFSVLGFGPPPPSQANILTDFSISDGFLVCCPTPEQNFNQRNELGKIRYAFTPSTALTVTWVGGQTGGSYFGAQLSPCLNVSFTPSSDYSGALPTGPITAFGGPNTGELLIQNMNLVEAEFHTPLGKTATLLLRQYGSSIQTFGGGPGHSGPTAAAPVSITAGVYGDVYYGASNYTAPTVFNGQVATVTINQYFELRSYNNLNGYTAEVDKQAGNDLLSVSYDQEKTSTLATQDLFAGTNSLVVPSGSSQTFRSVMGRAQLEFGPRVNATVSDNFGSYTDVFSQDGGITFKSATHTYQAPRLSLTWRPNANQSLRAAVGASVAPPYIKLLNNNTIIGVGPAEPIPYYTENANSGDVLPETALGFDVGFDTRIRSPFTVLSVDAYQTVLRNQFLQETFQQGTYTCTNPALEAYGQTAPLYVTRTANLGHSEYEGVELSLRHTPPKGWGFTIQGSLLRAFAYDLPAGFYDTAAGPNTTNLGILPNINFQQNAFSYNGMSNARVPYSTGYGEINYRGHNGAYFLAGVTYYGPNNSYNEPAFGVVTVSYNQPLAPRASLQFSIYNLTNAYPNMYFLFFGGTPINTPLINGLEGGANAQNVGPSTARITLHIDL